MCSKSLAREGGRGGGGGMVTYLTWGGGYLPWLVGGGTYLGWGWYLPWLGVGTYLGWGEGVPTLAWGGGVPTLAVVPPGCGQTNKLKLLPSPILRMRAVTILHGIREQNNEIYNHTQQFLRGKEKLQRCMARVIAVHTSISEKDSNVTPIVVALLVSDESHSSIQTMYLRHSVPFLWSNRVFNLDALSTTAISISAK